MKVRDIIAEATAAELEQAGLAGKGLSVYSDEFLYCLHLFVTSAGWRSMEPQRQERIAAAFDAEMRPLFTDSAGRGLVLWRGINFESMADLDPESDFTGRDRIVFRDYISATTDREYAEANCAGWRNPVSVLFQMRVPAGMRGIDLRDFRKYDFFFEDEAEVILQRNAAFTVVERRSEAIGRGDISPHDVVGINYPEQAHRRWFVELEAAA